MEQIIRNYAHDYRYIEMEEQRLYEMLINMTLDILDNEEKQLSEQANKEPYNKDYYELFTKQRNYIKNLKSEIVKENDTILTNENL